MNKTYNFYLIQWPQFRPQSLTGLDLEICFLILILRRPILWGTAASAVFVACVVNLDAVTEFLYYQF
jgi:hypothetical protein